MTVEALARPATRRHKENAIRRVMQAAAMVSVLISVLIIWSLFREAWTFITEIEWAKTWGQIGWFPRRGLYDVPTLLIATFIVTGVAMVVA